MPHETPAGERTQGTPAQSVIQRLQEAHTTRKQLRKADFTLTNGTAGQRSLIASYEAPYPLVIREDRLRLIVVFHEAFITDATGGNTETFSLANDIVDQPNTADLTLFLNGSQVQPDSIDYSADAFDYTDSGTGNTLHAFYVAADPLRLELEKVAPGSRGSMSELLYDDVTSLLHQRNQNKEPPMMEFERSLQPIVPRDWTIELYAEGAAYGVDWDDSDTDTSGNKTVNSVNALNAIVDIPIRQSDEEIPGLERAIREDIAQSRGRGAA